MQRDEMVKHQDLIEEKSAKKKRWENLRQQQRTSVLMIAVFFLGALSSYAIWGRPQQAALGVQAPLAPPASGAISDMAALIEQVNPSDGYDLGVSFGDLGPQVLEAGGIDLPAFIALYESSGSPLSDEQIEALTQKTDQQIIINADNARFILNFFWAVGLVNENPILTEGPITQRSEGQIDRFASTGGWTLGTKPVTDLFASRELIPLTPEQQARVEDAAALIYRPCCNNSTLFPDCNHGMAMLGLLELLASTDASVDEMLEAAKYVNAFWFPQQALEMAIFFETDQDESSSFRNASSALIVGKEMSSSSGFAALHQNLQTNGLLPQMPGSSNSCGA